MAEKVIGREMETKLLQRAVASKKNELIALYGRRRVGKTYLVRQLYEEEFDFSFTGCYEATKTVQLSNFARELSRYFHVQVKTPRTWYDAFEQLSQHLASLKKNKVLIFIDELPWLDTPKSDFLQAFCYFWNQWGQSINRLKVIICGSSTTWMIEKIIGDRGGLYGRVTLPIYLAPFTLGETESLLQKNGIYWNRYQTTECYMILGGIPHYINLLNKELTFDQNIDALFFCQGAPLHNEYTFLFRSLYREATLYRQIVETISTRCQGLTRNEIKKHLKLNDSGKLTEVLNNLVQCDFLRRYNAFGKSERDATYQLVDLFCLFHLRFVSKNNGQDEHFWSNMSENATRRTWRGYAFEQVCLHHIPQVKKALGISGVLSNISAWRTDPLVDKDETHWNGAQIDLIIDRKDQVIDLCEIKYASSAYAIDSEYGQWLRERTGTFRHHTKTRKALHTIFITPYGIKQNAHSGIVQQSITADELFQ